MFVDITDNKVICEKRKYGDFSLSVTRLSGSDKLLKLLLYNNVNKEQLWVGITHIETTWFLELYCTKHLLFKGSEIRINLENGDTIAVQISSAAFKSGEGWETLAIVKTDCIKTLSELYITSIEIPNKAGIIRTFEFGNEFNGQYNTYYEGAELFRRLNLLLLQRWQQYDKERQIYLQSSTHVATYDGPILNRQYNLNTQYGRRMARKQAQYNYDHGSDKYRSEVDNIKAVIWIVVIIIAVIIFFLKAQVQGSDEAVRWISH